MQVRLGPLSLPVVHAVPGRVRLRLAAGQAGPAARLLDGCELVRRYRVNAACDSLVIEHRGTLAQLARALRADRGQAASGVHPPGGRQPQPAHSPSEGFTLATAGMLLAAVPPVRALAQLSLAAAALPIWRRAWRVLAREKRLNVDFLDSLALAITLGRRQVATGGLMALLVHLGDWIRERTARQSRRRIRRLMRFEQMPCRRLARNGRVVTTPAARLRAGDRVRVLAGDLVPADARVVGGRAAIDQRHITGESAPVVPARSDMVYAGSPVLDGELTLQVVRAGPATAASRIAQLVEATPLGDTRIQNYAERWGDRLVAPVFGLNLALLLGSGNVDRFLSLAIVDYGTGIRVAAPTSVLAAMTRAAREGVLIKGGRQVEELAGLRGIALDKTGTLTTGCIQVEAVRTLRRGLSAGRLLHLAAALEQDIRHPIATALVRCSRQRAGRASALHAQDLRYALGLGVSGTVDGQRVHVGCERYLRSQGLALRRHAGLLREAQANGQSLVLVALDGELAGAFAVSDPLRPDASACIQALRQRGVRDVVMITGDRAYVARAVARRLGIRRVYPEVLPEHKAEIVASLRGRGGPLAMVGDGVNDAAALACADVGIAMGAGADIARESADVVLLHGGLSALPPAVDLCREALALVRQNFGIIAAANSVALGLSLPGGLVSPFACTILSNGSALVATLNSMRPLARGGPK